MKLHSLLVVVGKLQSHVASCEVVLSDALVIIIGLQIWPY